MRDYTDAPPPPPPDLIPNGTEATVSIHIRPGGIGEDEMLKRSSKGDCEMLDIEYTVVDSQYKGRKFWDNLIINGTTDGQKKMAAAHLNVLKAILDSALGLDPDDASAEARTARTVSVQWFEGKCFIAKIGIEKGGPIKNKPGESYPDKNTLAGVITKDKTGWHPVEQPPPFSDGGAPSGGTTPPTSAPPVARPGWAQ
jgi:hypothetical protein